FDGFKKGVVNVSRAALGFAGFRELVERAFEDSLAGKHSGNLVPARGVFGVMDVKDSPDGGAVIFIRLEAAVIDGKFLKVTQDAQGQLGRKTVTAKLEGGADIVLDVHGRAPGFEEKLSRAADAKTVIRRLGAVGGFVGVCVDYILVGFSAALLVINIPAEGFEE